MILLCEHKCLVYCSGGLVTPKVQASNTFTRQTEGSRWLRMLATWSVFGEDILGLTKYPIPALPLKRTHTPSGVKILVVITVTYHLLSRLPGPRDKTGHEKQGLSNCVTTRPADASTSTLCKIRIFQLN